MVNRSKTDEEERRLKSMIPVGLSKRNPAGSQACIECSKRSRKNTYRSLVILGIPFHQPIHYHLPNAFALYCPYEFRPLQNPASTSPPPTLHHSLFHFLPMQPVLQMHLKIINAHLRPRGIHFARTIQASNARVIHVFDVFLRLVYIEKYGLISGSADGGVPHCAFELIVGVALLEALKSLDEPLRGSRLEVRCG